MAGKTAILSVKVLTDTKNAQKGLDSYGSSVDRLQGKLNKAAVPAGLALAGLTALASKAGEAASRVEQSTGAVESVFKDQAAAIQGYADQAAGNVGLAKSQYQDLAAVLGAQLKNMGIPMEAVAGQTNDLVELGADLAATFGGSTADAVAALSSLMRGERDPIERYGVSIKQADIEAQKAAMGLAGLTGEAAKSADTQATLALLMKQTADAQGQFGREADTAAGRQERANAAWEDAQAKLGEKLLPIMAEGSRIAAEFAGWVSDNSDLVLILGGVIGGLAAGVLALNTALRVYRAIQVAATAAQWAFNVAAGANPIGLIILLIAGLIAAIVFLIANWDEVARVAGEVWNGIIGWIQDAIEWLNLDKYFAAIVAGWQLMGKIAGDVWNGIVGWIQDVIGWIQEAIDWVTRLFNGQMIADWLGLGGTDVYLHGGDPGGLDDGTGGWPPPSPARFGSPTTPVAGDVINITVNGALDADAVARQIKAILTGHGRKIGTFTAAGATA